jgi:DNA invertase Pin-like site-specific DNA recombinase
VFAEFENNLEKEREAEGIAAAKVRGVYKGRKPSAGCHLTAADRRLRRGLRDRAMCGVTT